MLASPLSGSERPTSMRIVVVLPAPLGPRKPVMVPGSQRNVTSETTVRPPSRLVSAWVSIMDADSRPASPATTARGLSLQRPAAVVGSDFGRGSQPPRSPSLRPVMATRLPRWLPSGLPDAYVDPPGKRRTRRDRVVDAGMYFVTFAIGTANIVDTWELHPPWLRPVAVLAVIGSVVCLRWRRTHPEAVGIGVSAVSVLLVTAPF